MKYYLLLTLVMLSVVGQCQTSNNTSGGRIEGTVQDQSGKPVDAARVYVVPQFPAFDEIVTPSVKTDAKGHFSFSKTFPLGTYKIYARKENEGYPDVSSAFYSDSRVSASEAYLTPEHPFATVYVDLGERASVLIGDVIDSQTHAAVKAKLVFVDDDGNNTSVVADGKYRVLLPPHKDLTMIVLPMDTAYSQSPVRHFRFDAGQKKHMEISLSKDDSATE